MPDALVTGAAVAGRAIGSDPSGGPAWLPRTVIERFAEQHHKALRFLNRGSIVTAAALDLVLQRRWPESAARPRGIALVVGSAFGNQGETTRYFQAIRTAGPEQVPPMASYDVAVNAFVNFCSMFFSLTGPVLTLSSGASSSADALASGFALLDDGETEAVLVVGAEQDSLEAFAYTGLGSTGASSEAAAVLLLERGDDDVTTLGRILAAETVFVAPGSVRAPAALRALVGRLLAARGVTPEALCAVSAGPSWTATHGLARAAVDASPAAWLDETPTHGGGLLGEAGAVQCLRLLAHLTEPSARGLALSGDPRGWFGAVLLGGANAPRAARPPAAPQEGEPCRP